ncbi:MAG TPA: YggS family pyridoxal phosphate-dependent enzyme [Deinococcales bacterium]|nr:YggS family pyridoxal phosphate-dependent enzyme [Deinococcales bacterium]
MLADVQNRIRRACAQAGRDPAGVRLVAVTKGHPAEEIAPLVAQGVTDIGESRVQEGLAKADAFPGLAVHLIGSLQRNKVKFASRFALIHSLDSLPLAEALARQADLGHVVPPVLVEVRLADDGAKHGIAPEGAPGLAREAARLGLDVRGVMTIGPRGDLPGTRRAFVRARELRDSLGLPELSMGMSGDFELAVLEGATLLRVGSALFAPPAGN